jgi:hypothetical protein
MPIQTLKNFWPGKVSWVEKSLAWRNICLGKVSGKSSLPRKGSLVWKGFLPGLRNLCPGTVFGKFDLPGKCFMEREITNSSQN